MAIWPFTRAYPLGYLNNQVPTHTELNKIDEQVAQAADGSLWTDIALVRNWFPIETYAGAGTDLIGEALVWEPTLGRWWSFGHTTGNVSTAYASYAGTNWFGSTLSGDAPATNWTQAKSAAQNSLGTIVCGGASNNTSKIRRSANAGVLWTPQFTIAAGSEVVNALGWAPSASLFVAGLSSSVTTNIETSPDGVTWTQRTAPNAHARQAAAASPTSVIVIADTNTDKCISSADGITWSERTLPTADTWRAIAYNAILNKYLALASGGGVAQSVDGITWSAVGLTAPASPGTGMFLCAIGRLWVVACNNKVQISADGAATWKQFDNFTMTSGFQFAAGPAQLLFAQGAAGNQTRRTLQGGL